MILTNLIGDLYRAVVFKLRFFYFLHISRASCAVSSGTERYITETYLEPLQVPKIERFASFANGF